MVQLLLFVVVLGLVFIAGPLLLTWQLTSRARPLPLHCGCIAVLIVTVPLGLLSLPAWLGIAMEEGPLVAFLVITGIYLAVALIAFGISAGAGAIISSLRVRRRNR